MTRRRPKQPGPRSADADYRVLGERAVVELLRAAPQRVERVLIARGRDMPEVRERAAAAKVVVQTCDPAALRDEARDAPARGVVAIARPPPMHDLEDLIESLTRGGDDRAVARRVLVALDGVQDPQNLGAILRSCAFFGVFGVFWARDRAAGLSGAVVRASAGATERVPLCQVTNLARALTTCQQAGAWVVGTVAEGGLALPAAVADDAVPDPLVLVLGGEHGGMRRLTQERCDLLVTIPSPRPPGTDVASLNVSAAAAVALSWLVAAPVHQSAPRSAPELPAGTDVV